MPLPSPRRGALLLVLCLASACSFVGGTRTIEGSGEAASEHRPVDEFSSVSFALPGSLQIVQSDAYSLRLEGDVNVLDHVETEVRDGTLRIRPAGRSRLVPRTPLRVVVHTPSLEGIESAGSGSVDAANLRVDRLSVSVAGSGETHLPNLEAEELRIQLAGSGKVAVSGVARRQVLSLAGSGGVDARDLQSETLEARLAGSGSAAVRVRDRLTANLAGSGSVQYIGDPEVSGNTVGSGRVVRADP